jgi:hypothetical protein
MLGQLLGTVFLGTIFWDNSLGLFLDNFLNKFFRQFFWTNVLDTSRGQILGTISLVNIFGRRFKCH